MSSLLLLGIPFFRRNVVERRLVIVIERFDLTVNLLLQAGNHRVVYIARKVVQRRFRFFFGNICHRFALNGKRNHAKPDFSRFSIHVDGLFSVSVLDDKGAANSPIEIDANSSHDLSYHDSIYRESTVPSLSAVGRCCDGISCNFENTFGFCKRRLIVQIVDAAAIWLHFARNIGSRCVGNLFFESVHLFFKFFFNNLLLLFEILVYFRARCRLLRLYGFWAVCIAGNRRTAKVRVSNIAQNGKEKISFHILHETRVHKLSKRV